MKKILNNLWKFIDKIIIVPLTKMVLKITKAYDSSGKNIEQWLTKSTTLLFVSLFLAVITFIIVDQKILVFSTSSAEVLKGQPVIAEYNEEAYVIEGLPESVDVTLIGSKANLYIAKQSTSQDILVDLTGLKPGKHKVNIKYSKDLPSVDYKINPSYATIIIYPKVSETKTLSYDLLNTEKLDNTKIIQNVNLGIEKVVIKGADYQLKEVAVVKALIDINNLVKQDLGEITLKDVPLKAYDVTGKAVDVEIVPSKIDVNLEIASPSKLLPVKVIPEGEVSFGKAISLISISEKEILVYGTEEELNNLTYIPIKIDVAGIKENQTYKKELIKPNGVKHMNVNNITIKVELGVVSSKDIEDINIEQRNLDSKYKVQGTSETSTKVTVSLKGVKEVIDNVNFQDVKAYVDLSGYGVGEHEVEVIIEGIENRVTYVSKTKKIKIKITE